MESVSEGFDKNNPGFEIKMTLGLKKK